MMDWLLKTEARHFSYRTSVIFNKSNCLICHFVFSNISNFFLKRIKNYKILRNELAFRLKQKNCRYNFKTERHE